jgi:hypothetical protein
MLSDNLLVVMFNAGMIAIGLAMALMLQILFVRVAWSRSDEFDKAAERKWGHILTMALAGDDPHPIEKLIGREQLPFMRVWLHLHASVRGDAVEILNAVAMQLRCDRMACQILLQNDRERQIVGILVSGYLKDKNAWQSLVPLASSRNSIVSMQAASAMLKIDAAAAMTQVMPMTINRADWSIADVGHMLRPNRELYIEAVLENLLAQTPYAILRALRLLQELKAVLPAALVEALLHQQSTDLKVAVLRLAAWSGQRQFVKKHVHDAEWPVRVAVANALRQIGTAEDLTSLEQLAGDTNWWVRYRAAEALVHLPFLSQKRLKILAETSPDRYTRDILQRVIAERNLQS